MLRSKMKEYYNYGKPEKLPEYLVHALLVALHSHSDQFDPCFIQEFVSYLAMSNRGVGVGALTIAQPNLQHIQGYSDGMLDGDLDCLDQATKVIEPWEVLADIVPNPTNDYKAILQEFAHMNEERMARMLVFIANNPQNLDDPVSKMLQPLVGGNNPDSIVQNFKDHYSQLNWGKVFEGLAVA